MIFSIWIIAISIQVGITVLLSFQFLRYKGNVTESLTSISVVIAAHNEFENLKMLIPALLNQTHENFEIIIVLDRCSDDSAQFLKDPSFQKVKVIEITKTPQDWDHKKYALSKGIEASTNEWIVLTDADCLPFSNRWLELINNRIQPNKKIILGCSPYRSNGSLLQNFIQYEAFVTAYNYLSMSLIGRPYMGVGRNLAINRSFFEEHVGYSKFKSTVGGDDDLFIQTNATAENTNISLGKESMMFTIPKNKWKEYIHQKTRHLSVGGSYSLSDRLLHTLFHGTLLLTWALLPLLILEKILPIMLFYLIVKWIGYRFAHSKMGAGFNYIWLPLVDFMYAIFLPIIAIRSKLVKDIRWKN